MSPESLNRLPFETWLALSFVCAFVVMAIIGRPMIAWLKNLEGMKWSAREDTPDTHAAKAGTPSMGGLGILLAATMAYSAVICAIVFVLGNFWGFARVPFPASSDFASTPLNGTPFQRVGAVHIVLSMAVLPILTLLHLALGLTDDWSKATGRGGLRARAKLLGQLALAGGFLLLLYWLAQNQSVQGIRFFASGTDRNFSFVALDAYSLAVMFVFLVIVIVGTCNAVNITDGIDGLAAGLCVQVGFALWLAGASAGRFDVKHWVDMWWLALAGACAGFLIFNKYKARVFMGDTGSLALGAALGAAAVLTRTVFLLPFIGFVFFVELLSVTLQVAYFKYTRKTGGEGKRIFRRAPLHHHFELGGWSEWRVVATFWAVNFVASAIGLALWSVGILPRFP